MEAVDMSLVGDNEIAVNGGGNNHGWQTVTYAKKPRKAPLKAADPVKVQANGSVGGGIEKAFKSLEKQSEERRRRLEAQRAAAIAADPEDTPGSKVRSDDDGDDSDAGAADIGAGQNGAPAEKKVKVKKVKKPKVTVAEAAAKIVAAELGDFLVEIKASFESQHDIQLMRFADYFGRAFSSVPASQFPWTKLFRESTVAKIADIPITHISEDVYKTSVDWVSKQPLADLQNFVLWALDSILADLAGQQGSVRGSKKSVQTSSKSQVAIFVVLAMALRRKPDALIGILPMLRENQRYQGQDKLLVIVWVIAQACQGDLCVGLYAWAHNLLPMVAGKSCNPQLRDLILQLVERIMSSPKARIVLVNGAVRRGERLLPPVSFDVLMRVTFPASSARVKATERFEAIYPTLKEVALAGSAGSKATKQLSQQIMTIAVKAAGEGNPELSNEAASVFIWCLIQNSDCYKQWDKIYMDSVEASVAFLRKITLEWDEFSAKQSSLDPMREAVKSFRHKNEKALASDDEAARWSLFKDTDKCCKVISVKLSRGNGCAKSLALAMIAIGIGAVVLAPSIESFDWSKIESLDWSKIESFEWTKFTEMFAQKFLK